MPLAGYAVALMLVLLGASASATEWVRCDACAPGEAESRVLNGMAPYERAVMNPAQEWARKFRVEQKMQGPGCDPNREAQASTGLDEGCILRTVAVEIPLTPGDQAFADTWAELYRASKGSMKVDAVVSAHNLTLPACPESDCVRASRSAYDVVRSARVESDVRGAIASTLHSISAVGRLMDWAVSTAHRVLDGAGTATVSVRIEFEDGSHAVYVFNSQTNPNGKRTEARDPSGNDIMTPDNAWRFVGTYGFPTSALARNFLDHASRIPGVEVPEGISSVNGQVRCAWTHGALNCRGKS